MSERLSVSVVVPVRGSEANFALCLASLSACAPAADEIIVVVDGPSDHTWPTVANPEVQLIKLERQAGPAHARNTGAAAATGAVVFFVDADVSVPPDAIGRIRRAFRETDELTALFGSYDDTPGEANFISQYKNLFHHYVHQNGRLEASTFWTACGAIRRDAFMKLGGFDDNYRTACIEDVELGYRLRAEGHAIRLMPELQAKHLKHWTFLSLLRTDIAHRALPWTRLIIAHKALVNDLNLTTRNRLSAAITCLLAATLCACASVPDLLYAAGALLAALLWRDRSLARFFLRKRGVWFAARAMPMVWCYYLYSSATFAAVLATHWRVPTRRATQSRP